MQGLVSTKRDTRTENSRGGPVSHSEAKHARRADVGDDVIPSEQRAALADQTEDCTGASWSALSRGVEDGLWRLCRDAALLFRVDRRRRIFFDIHERHWCLLEAGSSVQPRQLEATLSSGLGGSFAARSFFCQAWPFQSSCQLPRANKGQKADKNWLTQVVSSHETRRTRCKKWTFPRRYMAVNPGRHIISGTPASGPNGQVWR
ncbi:hypothetical protein BKA81DRAFT_399673 [Phyllosticta paracitricarpa]|uniref:Uncharacterized protein n=1 Tax=Phyllosticta citricarpa TaxID=55181 RepID=A0ABR1LTA6_9PEZI